MNTHFKFNNNYPARFIVFFKFFYWIKRWLRFLRVLKPVTQLMGQQYRPSLDLIEIDITYLCNLRCINCNRSCTQAPDSVHMPLDMIRKFVTDSINQNKVWRRIRILGGEPTLHPEFQTIIAELLKYNQFVPECKIEVVTNGYGSKVNAELAKLPKQIFIENSNKIGDIQPTFRPFNKAPQDQKLYAFTDFSNGCVIMSDCGIGLTPQGYYPCAIAGGIDRVLGLKSGRKEIPKNDDRMKDLCRDACRLCGRFEDGHYVPTKLRANLEKEIITSSWQAIYQDWEIRKIEVKDEPQKTKCS